MPVAGRVVIVTGGSQGMGKCVAILLAQKGAHVAIVARNQQKLDDALVEIKVCSSSPVARRTAADTKPRPQHVIQPKHSSPSQPTS